MLTCFAGYCRQHLWGGLGLLQAWHVIWDQRTEGTETSENFQDYQVSGTTKRTAFQLNKAWVVVYLCLYFHRLLFKNDKKICDFFFFFCQILGLSQEPGCVPHELHEVHYQPAFSSLSLRCGVCSAGDAAFWRKVSKRFQGHQSWQPRCFNYQGQLFLEYF